MAAAQIAQALRELNTGSRRQALEYVAQALASVGTEGTLIGARR
jgi:hypothetical protein